MRLGLWNYQWRAWDSVAGRTMTERLWERSPEVVCITEGKADPPESLAGHWIMSDADYGYRKFPGRRKVMLWSRNPWTEIERVGSENMPTGRFVSAWTRTSLGPVFFIGVCIPWRDAHVRSGRRDRSPWEENQSYLRGLNEVIHRKAHRGPCVLMGDFNQRVPRCGSPAWLFDELMDATRGLVWATDGPVPGLGKQVIDHVVHSDELHCLSTEGIDPTGDGGLRLSDHPGIVVEFGTAD